MDPILIAALLNFALLILAWLGLPASAATLLDPRDPVVLEGLHFESPG